MADKIIDMVAEEYLRSLKQRPEESSFLASENSKDEFKGTSSKKKKWVSKTPTTHTTTMLTFSQLEKSKLLEQSLEKNKNTLDFYSWQDLDLLCGNQATPGKNLHAKINRTVTTLGTCVLATTLVSPSSNQEEIVKNQQIAQILSSDHELKKNIGEQLNDIKEEEVKRTLLWSKSSSPLNHGSYVEELNSYFYTLSTARQSLEKGFKLWQPDPGDASKLQWVKRLSDFLFIYLSVIPLLFLHIVMLFGIYIVSKDITSFSFSILSYAIFCLFTMFIMWMGPYRYYKSKKPVILFLATHMRTLQVFLRAVSNLNNLLMSHPKLKKLCKDELVAIQQFLALGKKKGRLGQMIRFLQGNSCKNWGYFRSPTGKLLAHYTSFKKHKSVFGNIFYLVGKFDVHYSTACLLEESPNSAFQNGYVISEVISPTNNDDVVVFGEKVWHPCLPPEEAVANDLALDSQKGNRLIIITGANLGGKSTYILSDSLAVIMSQSLGVVAAKNFRHTCFKKVITYVNPTQNLARGLSLAGAAFEVLKTHKRALEETKGPVFAIIDEILNGVDAKMGLDVSMQTLKARYEKYPNCVTLLTTHYMELSQLDKLPGVVNKHVEAILSGKGMPINFTYKILDGVSDQNIVKDIATNMGIIDQIT